MLFIIGYPQGQSIELVIQYPQDLMKIVFLWPLIQLNVQDVFILMDTAQACYSNGNIAMLSIVSRVCNERTFVKVLMCFAVTANC